MLHYVTGNLLLGDCEIIAHQANCLSAMRSGIALQISQLYPEAAAADRNFPEPPQRRLGKFSLATVQRQGETRHIVNLYGQFAPGRERRMTNYEALYTALEAAVSHFRGQALKFGVPWRMGCDRAGGSWVVVEAMLRDISARLGMDIYVYQRPEDLQASGR